MTYINGDGIVDLDRPTWATRAERVQRGLIELDARWRALQEEPEEGAATAEYAVVLVAATSFAAVLLALLKSNATKTLLNNILKKALSVS